MANVCLDNQIFFTPLASEPKRRNLEPPAIGYTQSVTVVISSDDESEHGDFDDGQSDTFFPSIGELIRQSSKHKDAESGSVASAGLNTTSGCSNSDARVEPGTIADTCKGVDAPPGTSSYNDAKQSGEGSVMPPQVQESPASIPSLSDDESTKKRELANAEPSIQPSASQGRLNLQVGRRRHRDTNDGDYRPIEDSDAEHSQDDIVPPPQRKRRRMNTSILSTGGTAAQRQTHQYYADSRLTRQRSIIPTKDEYTTGNSKPTLRRLRYTPQDDANIRQLRDQGLSWLTIAEQFPGRSPSAIEVRYHTKLKTTPSREIPQLRDDPRAPLVVDDAGEEEWDVEEICNCRKLEDSGVELLVKWKGGDQTWEPFENMAETEALDKYERLHAAAAGVDAADLAMEVRRSSQAVKAEGDDYGDERRRVMLVDFDRAALLPYTLRSAPTSCRSHQEDRYHDYGGRRRPWQAME
ncbi:hypothetical protein B0H67DRAFT_650083 [Lasiosphaeris hirsuta]|uniref:Chromo domain-containing protein n=1 Tax=Lasiosphaeris hirsuta TaxID=260670 RepID=A0AA39ZS73_9PEZI|nr:hypothetical protein B0H67DRAFT_650083 [Lasiosphaeris hirsuta]